MDAPPLWVPKPRLFGSTGQNSGYAFCLGLRTLSQKGALIPHGDEGFLLPINPRLDRMLARGAPGRLFASIDRRAGIGFLSTRVPNAGQLHPQAPQTSQGYAFVAGRATQDGFVFSGRIRIAPGRPTRDETRASLDADEGMPVFALWTLPIHPTFMNERWAQLRRAVALAFAGWRLLGHGEDGLFLRIKRADLDNGLPCWPTPRFAFDGGSVVVGRTLGANIYDIQGEDLLLAPLVRTLDSIDLAPTDLSVNPESAFMGWRTPPLNTITASAHGRLAAHAAWAALNEGRLAAFATTLSPEDLR